MDSRPLLIVVSSMSRDAREPFFQSVAPRYRIWLLLGGPGREDSLTWERPYVVGHTVLDTVDTAATVAAARRVHARDPVCGVVCFDETRVLVAAAVATALGTPTSSPAAIARCRDKHATRLALAAAGVPQPRSAAVGSPADALRAARSIGFPVVLKPRDMACGFGVQLVASEAGVPAAFAHAAGITFPEVTREFDDTVLVEEYVAGPEISVDSAIVGGRVDPAVIARKQSGFPPAFEETGHLVDAADPLYDDPLLRDTLTRAHAAVGLHTGMTHTELKIGAAGFSVVEINARMGGGLIPHLGYLATGVDLSLAAAAVASGHPPDLRRTRTGVAAVRFYYPERDLTVGSIGIDEALLPANTERADILAEVGQEMMLPPRGGGWQSRLAQVVVTGSHAHECARSLDLAGDAILVRP